MKEILEEILEEKDVTKQFTEKLSLVISKMSMFFFESKGKYKIPDVFFTLNNRCNALVTAFVNPNSLYNKENKKVINYLGINPKWLNRELREVLATICHELCHIYENTYIHIPRGGYHDKQWEELMLSCGLKPVFMNKAKTSVSTQIIEGGEFDSFVNSFKEEFGEDYFNLVEYSTEIEKQLRKDVEGTEEDSDIPKADNAGKPIKKYNRNKIKYVCPSCDCKVWGKQGLDIYCNTCACNFELE